MLGQSIGGPARPGGDTSWGGRLAWLGVHPEVLSRVPILASHALVFRCHLNSDAVDRSVLWPGCSGGFRKSIRRDPHGYTSLSLMLSCTSTIAVRSKLCRKLSGCKSGCCIGTPMELFERNTPTPVLHHGFGAGGGPGQLCVCPCTCVCRHMLSSLAENH